MTEDSPGERDPRSMSHQQLARLADHLEDVEVVAKTPQWPTSASSAERRTEKRAEWTVALWFVLSALSAVAFVVTYSIWPDEYVRPSEDGYTYYALYTPVIGGTFGLAVLSLGIGLILHIKKFFPDELAVQQRHDGPSEETTRLTTAAKLAEIGEDTSIPRRPLIKRAMLTAAGLFGAATGVLLIGGFVRNPWAGGSQAALWVTGWKPVNGETVYLRAQTGVLGDIERVRPEDMQPGSMMTVFPFRESDRGEKELLLAAERASDAPVMLIRLRPGTHVTKRPGQEDFNYGDYYAFSKVCTHLGCPASQYDSQNHISLCPCHQSEFLITASAKPVFGPATRPLPQLPITVNAEGYFVARGDFVEPVGPGFWSMRKS
ncbi:menaquinol-cytochrome c reductase iron-sulfur subunit precursor [Halopolyspora algeriensis]|uniref:Cytochrome bc1 complex Rieske iron-sulfur subunit n=1 Tax=Halopolyspora algeriensis TaxID=1500506 RepID=A0A368W285_9ACTN|nr:Rieske 2Fe-2S domain-containing protein [Halopolyspora algeriensis]RCW46088.1 menaquinol-cytochrome c reductase iron-sulfur subunit precursor [Halopolyspora algeriensis]TQM55493.1 menaquinol-cytochrome c reductase iron-sulfur subunit precursor [Halopolyspora algeriensis]